jgi:hypothetical protein
MSAGTQSERLTEEQKSRLLPYLRDELEADARREVRPTSSVPIPRKDTPWMKKFAALAVFVAVTTWLRLEVHPWSLFFTLYMVGLIIWYIIGRLDDLAKENEKLRAELSSVKKWIDAK